MCEEDDQIQQEFEHFPQLYRHPYILLYDCISLPNVVCVSLLALEIFGLTLEAAETRLIQSVLLSHKACRSEAHAITPGKPRVSHRQRSRTSYFAGPWVGLVCFFAVFQRTSQLVVKLPADPIRSTCGCPHGMPVNSTPCTIDDGLEVGKGESNAYHVEERINRMVAKILTYMLGWWAHHFALCAVWYACGIHRFTLAARSSC